MIKSINEMTKEPFNRTKLTPQRKQKEIFDIIKIHSQQEGFSVVIGEPGVGKSVLREHIECLEKELIACAFNHIKQLLLRPPIKYILLLSSAFIVFKLIFNWR